MKKTGSLCHALLSIGLISASAWASTEFSQSIDRTEVGLEDVFRLTLTAVDAPGSAEIELPSSNDFETLSKSSSTQMSYQFGSGGSGMQRTQKIVLVMRATRLGHLTLPPALLRTDAKVFKTDPISLWVKKGLIGDVPSADSPDDAVVDAEPGIPRSDSDLFLRTQIDKPEAYVGEQITLSFNVYSRVDLSSVDALNLPKLEGFWNEDFENPTQLMGETRRVSGVPYRVYLLKRKALFPVKPGSHLIEAAEADLSTGFLFAGQRLHRKGNSVTVKVKPLPAGAPAGFTPSSVGQWQLSVEGPSSNSVELGQPVTLRVSLEGTGNIKNISVPTLPSLASVRAYEPTVTDKVQTSRGKMGGSRVLEYLVVPQQTGQLTIPPLTFPYFNPETVRYELARSNPLILSVHPSATSKNAPSAGTSLLADSAKNVLSGGKTAPLRIPALLERAPPAIWKTPYFLPALVLPAVFSLLIWLLSLGRKVRRSNPIAQRRAQANIALDRLKKAGRFPAADLQFYSEVEKSLLRFIASRLSQPVAGITRLELATKLQESRVEMIEQKRILGILEQCDLARFSPGARGIEPDRLLAGAREAIQGWP